MLRRESKAPHRFISNLRMKHVNRIVVKYIPTSFVLRQRSFSLAHRKDWKQHDFDRPLSKPLYLPQKHPSEVVLRWLCLLLLVVCSDEAHSSGQTVTADSWLRLLSSLSKAVTAPLCGCQTESIKPAISRMEIAATTWPLKPLWRPGPATTANNATDVTLLHSQTGCAPLQR